MNECVHHDHTIVEDYIRSLQWSPATTEHEKSLVNANIRGFYAHMLTRPSPAAVPAGLSDSDLFALFDVMDTAWVCATSPAEGRKDVAKAAREFLGRSNESSTIS